MAIAMMACGREVKQEQSIYFEEIAPQQLRDSSVVLKATASSGLPVLFANADDKIATIEGDRAVFHAAGRILIYALQSGNEDFYEAPGVYQNLLIRDWDPDKQTQTITFDLPSRWQLSIDGTILKLNATSTSGLPVKFTYAGPEIGILSANTLYLRHGGEIRAFPDKYNVTVKIIASQEGNDEYNPADNVEKEMHIIGDVLH
jgi:hypothetical protein